jgi:hypothetical protein
MGLNPQSNEHHEVVVGEGEVFLLESMTHSRELESSLKNKNQSLDLREREEEELKIWISRECLLFLSGQWP